MSLLLRDSVNRDGGVRAALRVQRPGWEMLCAADHLLLLSRHRAADTPLPFCVWLPCEVSRVESLVREVVSVAQETEADRPALSSLPGC